MSEDFEGAGTLAEAVRRHADDVPAGAAPWEALERRHRRGTVRRIAAGAGAALAAVLVAGALLTASPFTRAEPQPAAPVEAEPRGALTADPEFVAGLGRAVRAQRSEPLAVVYADDVGTDRIALVRQREPGGVVFEIWWVGPRGAEPEALQPTFGDEPAPLRTIVNDPEGGEFTVLAVAPPGGRMTVWAHDDVSAAGQQTSPWRDGEEIEPGVYTATLPAGVPHARVRISDVPGSRSGDLVDDATAVDGMLPGVVRVRDAAWWAAAGGGAFGPAPEKLEIQSVYDNLGLTPAAAGSTVLWVHRGAENTEVVASLAAPGGGFMLAAFEVYPVVRNDDGSTTSGTSVIAREPRGADPRTHGLVWRQRYQTGWDRPFAETANLVVAGPPGAVTAVPDRGAELRLSGGAGSGERPEATSVRFLDAQGREISEIAVSPLWQPGGSGG